MKKIDKNNYQEWALDYIEGNLDEKTKLEFERFLDTDKDAYDEVHLLMDDMPILPVSYEEFPCKSSFIRKNIFRTVLPYFKGAAAASVLIVLGMWLFSYNPMQRETILGNLSQETVDKRTKSYEPLHGINADMKDMQPDVSLSEKKQSSLAVSEPVSGLGENKSGKIKNNASEIVSSVVTQSEDVRIESKSDEDSVIGKNVVLGTILAETDAELVAEIPDIIAPEDINIVNADQLLSYKENEIEDEESGLSVGKTIVRGVSILLSPLPITKFETNRERGVEVASLIRISKTKSK